jgi:hypothetical protein
MTSEHANGESVGMTVRRRLGAAPHERDSCTQSGNCPDVFELADGDFAIIGRDVSFELDLPADAGRSESERTVVVPRDVLLSALRDLSGSV